MRRCLTDIVQNQATEEQEVSITIQHVTKSVLNFSSSYRTLHCFLIDINTKFQPTTEPYSDNGFGPRYSRVDRPLHHKCDFYLKHDAFGWV